MNMQQIMKQAQAMQKKMQEMQSEMENKEYEVTSGGGAVKLVMSGKSEIKNLEISKEIVAENDPELLSDLIIAAFNEAKGKIDAETKDGMSGMMGGMPMPPGFKMPF